MLGGRLIRAVIAAAVAAALGLALSGALDGLDERLVDTRFQIRGTDEPLADVVVVAIDDDAIAKHGPWPFDRRLHARVIERLRAAGARTIAYDVQFAGPSAHDRELIAAADRPDVVLGVLNLNEDGSPTIVAPRRLGDRVGFAGFPSEDGGSWRRFRGREQGIEHFAVRAAGGDPDAPLRRIDYTAKSDTIATLRFADVLEGRFAPDDVRDRIVVVGATADVLGDRHPTPVDAVMDGPDIHANAIQTVLDGYPLRDASGLVGVLMILVAAAIAPAAALTGRIVPPLAAGVGGAAVLLVGAQLAFDAGTVVPIAGPMLSLIVGTLGAVALTYATEVRARRRVRLAFERFVPPAVIDEVVKRDEMAPKRVQATMLFCDLRGFTTLGEQLDAEQVIAALNRYLEMVSGAVFDHGGTVVSYQGDGVLAVFGAPLDQPDHARRAVAAGRQILEEGLPAYNRWLADSGLATQPLSAGIGINSGPVMAGSVGSSKRLEYAAVGDTTNVAARLQALGRDHDARMFVSSTTYEQLGPDANGLRELGPVELKGRHEPVTVYAQ